MGKSIDKRLSELGGKRLLDLACADEGTGQLEVTVEKWKLDIMEKVIELSKGGDDKTDKADKMVESGHINAKLDIMQKFIESNKGGDNITDKDDKGVENGNSNADAASISSEMAMSVEVEPSKVC